MWFIKKGSGRGFILAELLVTIAIISIIAAIVMVSLTGQQKKARDSKRKSDLSDIRNALQLYYNDNGYYPDSNTGSAYNKLSTATQPWIGGLTSDYIKEVPKDSKNDSSYNYIYDTPAGHLTYKIAANLENDSDPQRSGNCYSPTTDYDYCITSP